MTEAKCGIYKITSPTNKVYIGQSINIGKRLASYKIKYAATSQTILGRSLAKYGWKAHRFEIIIECLPSELNELEIKYIAQFNSFNSNTGMNAMSGGKKGWTFSDIVMQKLREPKSEETKEKFRIGAKNRPPISEETREKHRARMLGRTVKESTRELKRIISSGKTHTEETKLKIKKIKTGIRLSEEAKQKLRGKRGRPVIQLSKKDLTAIKEFPSAAIAGQKLECSGSDIIQCCKGNRNHVKGFLFKYKYPIKNHPDNVK